LGIVVDVLLSFSCLTDGASRERSIWFERTRKYRRFEFDALL